jgi:putative endonuclease
MLSSSCCALSFARSAYRDEKPRRARSPLVPESRPFVPERRVPFVYLLSCRDGSLYAGAAVDLERRFREHCAGRASRYTRARLPVAIAWSVEVESWSAALVEEARIKRLDRAEKLALVEAAVRKQKRRIAQRARRAPDR